MTRERAHRAGFSLAEALVASALFLLIVLGILPLFTRAALWNATGRRATESAHLAGSQAETLERLPFHGARLAGSSGGESRIVEYWDPALHAWVDHPPAGGSPWSRTTVVRRLPAAAAADGRLADTEPAALAGAHLREIRVTVRPARRGRPGSHTRQTTYRLLRSF